jgi:hypothetical protein
MGSNNFRDQHDMDIKDLAGISRPLGRLVEVVAQGIGAISAPLLTRWNASADAHKIEKISKAIKGTTEAHNLPVEYSDEKMKISNAIYENTILTENNTIEDRLRMRLDFQEKKRQSNIEDITSVAAQVLLDNEEVSDQKPNEDWVMRFFSGAQDISSDQMKDLWGRILAGEIKKPGSFSLRRCGRI